MNKDLLFIQKYDYLKAPETLSYYKKSDLIIHNKNFDFKHLVHTRS